jgi:hypothetical protein
MLVGGIQDVAYGLRSMVGCQRRNRVESIDANGVDVSVIRHDRSGWRLRVSTRMQLVIIITLALTLVDYHDDQDRSSPRTRERIGPMPGG